MLATLSLLLPTVLYSLLSTSGAMTGKTVNHLAKRPSLGQSYFALRHGQSLANVAKIISSDPAISTKEHGLSDVGKQQARAAGASFAAAHCEENDENCKGVAVFSSDFTRARETASIFSDELNKSDIPLYSGGVEHKTSLRERNFGELNGGPDSRYNDVWVFDAKDPDNNAYGAESPNSVLERTTALVVDLDEKLGTEVSGDEYWKVVLVAHGDVLQIIQTGFLKHKDGSQHRSLQHLETATIRPLPLAS